MNTPHVRLFHHLLKAHQRWQGLLMVVCSCILVLISGCQPSDPPSKRPTLRIVTLPLLTSYTPLQTLDDQGNPVEFISGFDHDLASRFADSLGRDPVFIVAASYEELVDQLKTGKADMTAAWLPKSFVENQQLITGPGYGWMQPVLLKRTRNLPATRLAPSRLSSKPDQRINQDLKPEIRRIQALALPETYPSEPAISALICSDQSAEIATSIFPNLSIYATKEKKQEVVWAFAAPDIAPSGLVNLKAEAESFLKDLNARGRMSQIRDRHFGALRKLPTGDKLAFLERSQTILPIYEPIFKQAQTQTGVDWRLLASLGYQESHWNPLATSPTGVRSRLEANDHK